MDKNKFYSQLFRREIYSSEPEYETKVRTETLYRHYKLVKEKCSCMQCIRDLKKLNEYLVKRL